MVRYAPLILAISVLSPSAVMAGDAHRELGPHVHGRGTFNIAVERNRIEIEFEAPAHDIVGFEHAPSTDREKAAIDGARAKLSSPLGTVFTVPAAAGCRLAQASVAMEVEDHDDEEKPGSKAPAQSDRDHHHSAFHAQYVLEGKSVRDITSLDFGYFSMFPGAEALDINLIAGRGQTKLEATRNKPGVRIDDGM